MDLTQVHYDRTSTRVYVSTYSSCKFFNLLSYAHLSTTRNSELLPALPADTLPELIEPKVGQNGHLLGSRRHRKYKMPMPLVKKREPPTLKAKVAIDAIKRHKTTFPPHLRKDGAQAIYRLVSTGRLGSRANNCNVRAAEHCHN